ncbi:MAG: hypothetical protein ACREQC_11640, partial [Candidatus Binataceae bacterium]
LKSLPEGIEKAHIRGVLKRLASDIESLKPCPSGDFKGGFYVFAGPKDKWKITYQILELEEPVVNVVTIKKRITLPWALAFYPKDDCQ